MQQVAQRLQSPSVLEAVALDRLEIPDFKQHLLERYPVFRQDDKVWEELAGWEFDPVTLFWGAVPVAATTGTPDIAWVYGVSAKNMTFSNWFYVFGEDLQWTALHFDNEGKMQDVLTARDMPVTGFTYCRDVSELALNIPLVSADAQGGAVFTDNWAPYPQANRVQDRSR